MKFATADILSITTGHLFGNVETSYSVVAFLIGRDAAFADDVANFRAAVTTAIKAEIPDIPIEEDAADVTPANYRERLSEWEGQFGREIELPDSMRGAVS